MSDRKFLLGRCLVKPVSGNEKMLALLDRLLLSFSKSDAAGVLNGVDRGELVEIQVNLDTLVNAGEMGDPVTEAHTSDSLEQVAGETIRGLLSLAMAEHSSVIWLDAAVLVAPSGHLFMLVGPSMSGKTTLTLAMHLAQRWRVLSEDMALIDQNNCRILSFARPSSIRQGCLEKIENAIGQPVEQCRLKEWFFRPEMFLNGELPAKFSAVFKLEPIGEEPILDMVLEEQTAPQMVRALMQLSNCLRLPEAVKFLLEAISTARCYKLTGGSLAERMQALLDVAGQLEHP